MILMWTTCSGQHKYILTMFLVILSLIRYIHVEAPPFYSSLCSFFICRVCVQ